MNQRQKEVIRLQLDKEKAMIDELKNVYSLAAEDVENKIRELSARTDMEHLQSIIYQKQYQEVLKRQIDTVLDVLNTNEFSTIQEYLIEAYNDGYIATMYDIAGQGIPLILPVDPKQVVEALQTDSKISTSLYTRLGEDTKYLKKNIRAEISRGIAQGLMWNQIAVEIANGMKSDYNKSINNAIRIARTEGHRIQTKAAFDAQHKAKDKGANIVKQWDSTLDGRTRSSHRQVDGEIRELDEKFSNGLMYPGDSHGPAAEVVNCRCALLQRAKWALDEEELKTLKEHAEFWGLDKTKDFDDFKEKYLKASKDVEKSTQSSRMKMNIQLFANIPKEKFTDYSLNPIKSPDKAKAFKEALGYDLDNYTDLIKNVENHINESKFVEKGDSGFGMKYEYIMNITGANGKKSKCSYCMDSRRRRETFNQYLCN